MTSPKIGVVVAITTNSLDYMGMALVLQRSVIENGGDYPWDFVALVADSVSEADCESLSQRGWTIQRVGLPVSLAEISGPLRSVIEKSGCCGPIELIKLKVFSMTQYERVIFFDADAFVLKSLKGLVESQDTQYTLDKGLGGGCINGGFLATTPNADDYKEMLNVVRRGDFRDGTAWGGTNVGWCWGGQTFQGVVPYYFEFFRNSERFDEMDVKVYNNMGKYVDAPGHDVPYVGSIDDVVTAHFTWCQKPPHECHPQTEYCRAFHRKFWEVFSHIESPENNPALKQLSNQDKTCKR